MSHFVKKIPLRRNQCVLLLCRKQLWFRRWKAVTKRLSFTFRHHCWHKYLKEILHIICISKLREETQSHPLILNVLLLVLKEGVVWNYNKVLNSLKPHLPVQSLMAVPRWEVGILKLQGGWSVKSRASEKLVSVPRDTTETGNLRVIKCLSKRVRTLGGVTGRKWFWLRYDSQTKTYNVILRFRTVCS